MSRKRSRSRADLQDDSERNDAHPEPSHLQHKRSRVALAAENGGSVVSDEDDYELSIDDDDNLREGADTSLDQTMASSGDEEEEADEFDEMKATQIVEKQIRQHRENIAAEEGVIEEVYCRNFMCHNKLRIKLGPLINFIIGHNGSGKSAVLTALTMCLGGKATATNRGANLKSLIKEGEENATLAVKIKNQGENAYKPDLYGQSIVVERHFSRAGTSGFKIKNDKDRIVTTKKADLDDILDYFAFQLDNPINVLTQDMARQFLSNSTPSDKYKFFIRGTQLETLDSDYKLLEEHLDGMEEKLALRQSDIASLRERAREAEARKKRLDASRTVQARITSLQEQYAWAQVEEQEATLEKFREDALRGEQSMQEKRETAEVVSSTFEGHNQAYEPAQRLVEELKEEQAGKREAERGAKEQFDSNTQQLKAIQVEQRNIRESVKKAKRDIATHTNEIALEEERLAGLAGSAHTDRLAALEQLQESAVQAKASFQDHGLQKNELDRAHSAAKRHQDEAKEAARVAQEALRHQRDALDNLGRNQGSRFAGYHQNMERLVGAIDRETRWRSKPVGPMGLHVRLLKPEWSSQLEKTFGGVLNSFVVTCKDDQVLLSQLLSRINCPGSNVFIGDPRPLDTTGKEPTAEVDTILRVLTIDNDQVRNSLIINQAIEQVALIKDFKEGEQFMSTRPSNVKATISFNADPAWGIRIDFSRGGGLRSGPVEPWRGGSRMKTNREEQVRLQNERVQQARAAFDVAEQAARAQTNALTKAQQALTRFKREGDALRIASQEAEDAVEALQNEIEGNRPQDGRLQQLQKELEESRSEHENAESSYQDSVLAKDKYDGIARELKTKLDAAAQELLDYDSKVAKADRRRQNLENSRHQALLEKNAALEAAATASAHLTRLQEKVEEQQRLVDEDFIAVARQICERVPVEDGLTTSALDKRIEKLKADLTRIEREAGGTREQLTEAWKAAALEFRHAQQQMQEMENTAMILKRTLRERHRRWGLFRKYITARARLNFSYLLSERMFRGQVLVNHTSKLLDISVEPDLTKVSDAGRQVKTLSGGEKSFSTVCLLLSIWEAMGSPIRCLDEFDVFMDSVNRAKSTSMMITAARRSVSRQFILITPQSMNNVELGDDVKIHRMRDPERGQTTLDFAN